MHWKERLRHVKILFKIKIKRKRYKILFGYDLMMSQYMMSAITHTCKKGNVVPYIMHELNNTFCVIWEIGRSFFLKKTQVEYVMSA